ncbi:hypothetical protein BAUCODRAFT_445424 [Baudoinia panamericana UAMH 10762]|uniref:Uncharacterized protein n=1 Tax=Baudoinia panamericana (strain UAMH 10762) TaxID=717646 RepID=M2N030_BAUPA|nr:uncharacterized protein BAUCODRAFT_445424 [Baudoinia panamericana UAMH 10762]EMC97273.1 hypothetical protein BAUCODRAFT_445424 [Baudoinia panamericana UAMH 10762]
MNVDSYTNQYLFLFGFDFDFVLLSAYLVQGSQFSISRHLLTTAPMYKYANPWLSVFTGKDKLLFASKTTSLLKHSYPLVLVEQGANPDLDTISHLLQYTVVCLHMLLVLYFVNMFSRAAPCPPSCAASPPRPGSRPTTHSRTASRTGRHEDLRPHHPRHVQPQLAVRHAHNRARRPALHLVQVHAHEPILGRVAGLRPDRGPLLHLV